MASKVSGLYLRGRKYWLRAIAPLDLQAAFYNGKRIAFNGTLGTGDPQVARAKAASIRADLEAQFLRQRRELSPPKLASVAPEVRRCIVETLLAEQIALDAKQRADKTGTTRVHSPIVVGYEAEDGTLPERPPVAPVSVLRPLASDVVTARAALNQKRRALVRQALATGNLEVMLPIVQPIVKKLGLAIDYETPDGAMLLQEALAAYSKARDTAVERDQGLVVPTPPMPAVPALVADSASTRTDDASARLNSVKADWLAIKARNKPAIKIMDRALKLMADAGVDFPLAELDRQHGAKLRANLVAKGLKGQSVKNLLVPLQSLLNVAVDSGKLKANPWAGLKIDTSDSVQRLPWRLEDLKKLATANNRHTDAGRWLFPLALYSGARAGEMAQAEVKDIQQIDGVWCLEIHGRASDDNKLRTVKTKAGERLLPISQHLVDLGFLANIEQARVSGARFVFPEFIGNGKRLPSDFASAYFLQLRQEAGVQIDERFTLHSTRHNVRSALAAAAVNDQIIDKLIGHESGTVQGRYTHATTATLAEAIAKLDWTALGLR